MDLGDFDVLYTPVPWENRIEYLETGISPLVQMGVFSGALLFTTRENAAEYGERFGFRTSILQVDPAACQQGAIVTAAESGRDLGPKAEFVVNGFIPGSAMAFALKATEMHVERRP